MNTLRVSKHSTYDEVVAFAKEVGIENVGKMKKVDILALIDKVWNETDVEVARPGRPVDPNSEHYKRQQELETKREAGELKRGRPIDPSSERQKRLAAKGEGQDRPGRPIDPNSERQKRLAEMEEKKKKGALRQGRPVDPNSSRQKRLAGQMAKKVAALKENGELKDIVAEVKATSKEEKVKEVA